MKDKEPTPAELIGNMQLLIERQRAIDRAMALNTLDMRDEFERLESENSSLRNQVKELEARLAEKQEWINSHL